MWLDLQKIIDTSTHVEMLSIVHEMENDQKKQVLPGD